MRLHKTEVKAMLPHFLIPGAQKAGTTTLNAVLRDHPDCLMTRNPDYPFFAVSDYEQRLDEYKNNFEGTEKSSDSFEAIGDICPSYYWIEELPGRLLETLGSDLKLLFILRNPLERAFSAYHHQLNNNYEQRGPDEVFDFEATSIDEIIEEEKKIVSKTFDKDYYREELIDYPVEYPLKPFHYITNSIYSIHIENFLNKFETENLKIVFLEDLAEKPDHFMDEVTNFLDIKPDFRPDNLYVAHNKTRESQSLLYRMVDKVKFLVPDFIKRAQGLRFLYETIADREKPTLSSDLKNNLSFIVESEAEKLDHHTDKNLKKLWDL